MYEKTDIPELVVQTLGDWKPDQREAYGLDDLYDQAALYLDVQDAQREGYEVRPDPDQEGYYYFVDPHGNYSDISYDDVGEAWKVVVAEHQADTPG